MYFLGREILDKTNLVNQKTPNDESGEHDSRGVIFLPDLDMDVVEGHVVLSSKHWVECRIIRNSCLCQNITDGEDDNDVQHLPWNKEEDGEEYEGQRDEVVCLEIIKVIMSSSQSDVSLAEI